MEFSFYLLIVNVIAIVVTSMELTLARYQSMVPIGVISLLLLIRKARLNIRQAISCGTAVINCSSILGLLHISQAQVRSVGHKYVDLNRVYCT